MFKKIITSIVLACFIFVNAGVYFAQTAHAQENTWYYQEWADWYSRVYDPDSPDEIFGERYTAAQVEWVIYGLMAFVLNHVFGGSGLPGCLVGEALMGDGDWGACASFLEDAICSLADNGTIPTPIFCLGASNFEASSQRLATKNPVQDILSGARPISGIGYIRKAASKFHLASEVQAQGFGFEAASSMRGLWVAVRNVTYFILVLMIIGMAFMVMFRFKTSPQTIITIQSALPKIIIALLLITFSYAIAGFMIDLLYVVIGIIAAILTSTDPELFGLDWGEMYNRLTGATAGTGILGTMAIYFLLFAVTAVITFLSSGTFLGLVFALLSPIILIVILIALIFITLKIMWMLIKTFVTVLLLIAVSPIFIITGGFVGWLKNLASHLAVFAAIGPMFAVSYLFLGSALPDGWLSDALFGLFGGIIPFDPQPNVIGTENWTPPFLGMSDMNIVWLFASFVILTLIPNVSNMIKSAIQGKPFGYGTAIGAAIGGAAGVAWSPFGGQVSAVKDAFYKDRSTRIMQAVQGGKVGTRLKRLIGV
jgi:hypothetical protein